MQQDRASKKQQELLSFVDDFIKANGYGPSYREIMNGLGYKSVSTVAIHIEGLISKGYLARRDKSARSLEVVSLSPTAQPAAKSQPPVDIEAELIKILKTKELTNEQRATLAAAFELLEFERATTMMKEPDETTSE